MYSVVLYGATGFTGKLATAYLVKQYAGAPWKWAIGGRSREKLERLRDSLGADCGVLVADSADEVALTEMVKQTKVVVSFAGPFCRYGSKLVAACAANGTDYCDITGELTWVRDMIALHDDKARETGARIVNCCGHDSMPWDLMTMKLATKLKEMGAGELQSVDMWDKIRSGPSGGTLETVFELMLNKKPPAPEAKALGYDPLLKTIAGSEKSTYGLKIQNVNTVDLSSPEGPPRLLFVMAAANACVVKRSNALLGYGQKVTYREGMEASSKWKACGTFLQLAMLGLLLAFPPSRALLRRFVLPKPGEGPSEEAMKKGFLIVTGLGKSVDGKAVKARLTFSVDPGYMDTARMAVEAGLTLALEGDKVASKGGVLTCASCQGDTLLQRLVATGSTFEYVQA